jgi:hypothetical protein
LEIGVVGFIVSVMKLEELAEEVSKLPTRERAALAAEILHGLDAGMNRGHR